MKAVIYARYSSSSQTEQSIEGQMRVCNDYAKTHDITVVDSYIDRAISGTTDQRPQFQKMLKDSDKGLFDAVIVYKTDRFARNRYDSAIYKARLKKNGVKVLYAQEHIPDGPEGIILESLLEGMAEYYSAELSVKIKRGIHESALKCKALGGKVVIGYATAEDLTYIIDPDTAPVVRKAFELYDQGKPALQICDFLNTQGFRTSRGNLFNKNSLRTIFHNEKYIGVYKHGAIRVEGGLPAIVDRDLFDRVQKRMAINKQAPARQKAKIPYLLSGKTYCGTCGEGMIGDSGTSKQGTTHYYYTCRGKKQAKTCKKKSVKRDWLENAVVDETLKHVLQPEKAAAIAAQCVATAALERKERSEHSGLTLLKKRMSETLKAKANLMAAIEQGLITKTTKARLQELETTEEKIEFEIAQCKIKLPTLTEEQVLFMLKQFQRGGASKEEYNARIIDCFVHAVYVYDDKLIITYNLTNEQGDLDSSTVASIFKKHKSSSFAHLSPPDKVKSEHSIIVLYWSGFLMLQTRI